MCALENLTAVYCMEKEVPGTHRLGGVLLQQADLCLLLPNPPLSSDSPLHASSNLSNTRTRKDARLHQFEKKATLHTTAPRHMDTQERKDNKQHCQVVQAAVAVAKLGIAGWRK